MNHDHSPVIQELLSHIQHHLYRGKKPPRQFFAERQMLIATVTYPAQWLKDRGGAITPAEYSTLVKSILRGIWQHGQCDQIRNVPRYLLKSVQEHMRHHGDEILDRQKRIAQAIRRSMRGLLADHPPAQPHPIVDDLAIVHAHTRIKFKRPPRPASNQPALPGL